MVAAPLPLLSTSAVARNNWLSPAMVNTSPARMLSLVLAGHPSVAMLVPASVAPTTRGVPPPVPLAGMPEPGSR